jgi:hypothetical protein
LEAYFTAKETRERFTLPGLRVFTGFEAVHFSRNPQHPNGHGIEGLPI